MSLYNILSLLVFCLIVIMITLFLRCAGINERKDCQYTCERYGMIYDNWERGIYCSCKNHFGDVFKYSKILRPKDKNE